MGTLNHRVLGKKSTWRILCSPSVQGQCVLGVRPAEKCLLKGPGSESPRSLKEVEWWCHEAETFEMRTRLCVHHVWCRGRIPGFGGRPVKKNSTKLWIRNEVWGNYLFSTGKETTINSTSEKTEKHGKIQKNNLLLLASCLTYCLSTCSSCKEIQPFLQHRWWEVVFHFWWLGSIKHGTLRQLNNLYEI